MGIGKEQEAVIAPFIIRGHHLHHYADLLREKDLSAAEFASETIIGIPQDEKFAVRDGEEIKELNYVGDVFGRVDQARHFSDTTTRVYCEFLSLPNDFPVEISVSKDDICNSCAVGRHCLERQRGDIEDINVFVNCLKPGIRKKLQASPEFPDKITTTLGVVRRILSQSSWDRRPTPNVSSSL